MARQRIRNRWPREGGRCTKEISMVTSQLDRPLHVPHAKYERLSAAAKEVPAASTIVVHPCDETSLRCCVDAAKAGIITPILVGPAARIRMAGRNYKLDVEQFEIVDTENIESASAAKA